MTKQLFSAIPAGLIDAGCASLATFIVGVFAVRSLDPSSLGTYALFFSGFVTLSIVPSQLVFVPAEIITLRDVGLRRLSLLKRSLGNGALFAAGASALGAVGSSLLSTSPSDVTVAFALTAAVAGTVSPLQDHVRRVQHMAGLSWNAAGMSISQLIVVTGGFLFVGELGIPGPWLPFSVLAMANVVSTALGTWWAARRRDGAVSVHYTMRDVAQRGKWLLGLAILPSLAFYAASAIILRVAGSSALGYAEAARVAAQPLFVLVTGLSAVLGPRLMEAGRERSRAEGNRLAQAHLIAFGPAAVLYIAIAGWDWIGNPLSVLMPRAYALPGLAALSMVVPLVNGSTSPFQSELIGAGRERRLMLLQTASNVTPILVAGTAAITGAYARPLGLLGQTTILLLIVLRMRAMHYRSRVG